MPRYLTLLAGLLLATAMPTVSNADSGLVGEWQLRVEGRRGIQTPVLTVTEQDGAFSGTIGGQRGQVAIDTITVDEAGFSFPFAMTTPMGEFKLLYKGVRDSDSLTGTVDTPRGEIPFSGQRIQN